MNNFVIWFVRNWEREDVFVVLVMLHVDRSQLVSATESEGQNVSRVKLLLVCYGWGHVDGIWKPQGSLHWLSSW